MKKLLITAFAACLAIASQAATASWKATAVNIFDGTGTSTRYSGTAFIFDAGVKSQSALFDIIAAGTTIGSGTEGYVGTGTVSNGSLPNTTSFDYVNQSASASDLTNYSYYFVILNGDDAYFSNVKEVSANATATAKTITFGAQAGSNAAPTATGYAGEGKWSSVPEPTSAMLLMLGICGLALKRKNS